MVPSDGADPWLAKVLRWYRVLGWCHGLMPVACLLTRSVACGSFILPGSVVDPCTLHHLPMAPVLQVDLLQAATDRQYFVNLVKRCEDDLDVWRRMHM